jgi:hypothetical protein
LKNNFLEKLLGCYMRRPDRCRILHLSVAGVLAGGLLSACGGGGGGSSAPPPPQSTYTATSGVAQKGPLQAGSTVTAQELSAALAPTGKEYTYQITANLGTFSPSSTFGSRYIGLVATGYYFDESLNAVSGGTITLNAYCDLGASSTLNVNLLTTLAYQRIQALVNTGMTFTDATTQAENEVLAALNIQHGASYGLFSSLDIGKGTDADHMLAALSGLFDYGNTSGNLSALIAAFESDIAKNGKITSAATAATLAASAKALNPAAIAANLSQVYASVGANYTATDISDWLDQDGDGLVGKFKFQMPDATQASSFTFPSFVTDPNAGGSISVSAGQLSLNGAPVTGSVSIKSGDAVAVAPSKGVFPNGAVSIYLLSGSTRIARITFVAGLMSIDVAPANAIIQVGATQQFAATGTFSDSSTANLTASVAWTATASATVNATTGLATGVAPGNSTITATSGSVSGSTTLQVIPAALMSIAITPNPFATGVGIARQLTATGTYSDNSTANITNSVVWSSTPGVMVTGGLVSGVSLGPATVTSTLGSVSASLPLSVSSGSWWFAASMIAARTGHVATMLQNGKVLVTPGSNAMPAPMPPLSGPPAAEIYDPAADTWSATGYMVTIPDYSPTATLLPNGKVLVTGGAADGGAALATTELYDPVTNAWSAGPSMSAARYQSAATLLPNGRVLVSGGAPNAQALATPAYTTSEIYDPATNSWSTAASMTTGHYGHTAVLLANGIVLIAGGITQSSGGADQATADAETYDPGANTWSVVGSLNVPRVGHTMALLKNGKVLVAGGAGPLSSAELYDPAAKTWTVTGSMNSPRTVHTMTALPDGTAIVAGGSSSSNTNLSSAEIYDPSAGTWSLTGFLSFAREGAAAALLSNGAVLVCGGSVQANASVTDPFGNYNSSCELYW